MNQLIRVAPHIGPSVGRLPAAVGATLVLAVTLLAVAFLIAGPEPAVAQAPAPVQVSVQESIAVIDAIGVFPPVDLFVPEDVLVADAIGIFPPLDLLVSEDVLVTDGIGVFPSLNLLVSEDVLVADAIGVFPPVVLLVTESLLVADVLDTLTCGSTITTDTVLFADITGCPGKGLEIRTNGITLDCAGHTITGPGTRNDPKVAGILVRADNVAVKNCNVRGFDIGADVARLGGTYTGNSFSGNGVGAQSQAPGAIWTGNTFNDNLEMGAHNIGNAPGNIFINNTANGNGFDPAPGRPSDGFHIAGDGAELTGNTANDNMRKGIAIVGADNVLVDGNTANDNHRYGIYLQTANNNTVRNNTATGNFFGGYRLQSGSAGNTISHNNAINNGLNPCCRPGFQVVLGMNNTGQDNTFSNNLARGNAIGFQIAGTQTVSNNTVRASVLSGILLSGTDGTMVIGNLFEDNSPQFIAGLRAAILMNSDANNNTIEDNIIRNNQNYGVLFHITSTGNVFRRNRITGNSVAGVFFSGLTDTNNTFSDNFFNNETNVGVLVNVPNTWNIAATPGVNIVEGPSLGGNFYGKPNGTGYSQTCLDADADGFCDTPLVFNADNVDGLPLRDIILPVVTAPAGITVKAEGPLGTPAATLAAFLSATTAEDNIDGVVNVTNDAPADFPLGDTVVTFSAADLTGNVGTATATVTVEDTTPPVVTTPPKLVVAVEVAGKGGAGTTPATSAKIAAFLSGATASDNVDLVLGVVNDAPKIFPEGITQVSFRATDLSGNTTTAVSSVLVIEDGDGIHPFVDGQIVDGKFIDESLRFSNNFTDQHIARGSTFGFIVDRGGLAVTVEDLAVGGVLLGAEGADDTSAGVNVCGTLIKLGTGKLVEATCGSLILEVIVGPVDVLNSAENTTVSVASETTVTVTETTTGELELQLGDSIVATVPQNTEATVTDTGNNEFQIVNSPDSENPVVVEVEGQVIILEPGESPVAVTTEGKDFDGDLVPDSTDACVDTPGLPKRQGCPVGDLNIVTLHVIDQAKSGACPNGDGSCQFLVTGALVRVFDRNDADFQTAYGKNPSGGIYDQVFENDIGRVGACTTALNGACIAGEEFIGDYLVVVKYFDLETGKTVYTGKPKSPGDFVDTDGDGVRDLATKDFQIIKVLKKDGSIQFSGGSKTVINGSYLEILQPDYAVWDEGVSSYIYPFIFTADSTWEVDVCTQVPQGYTIVGVYDGTGTLVSDTSCAQTVVADETKVIAFDVLDLESPPPHVKTRFKIKHKGKLHQFDLDVPGHRKGKDKKPRKSKEAP